jgi:site-specific DNA-methyltransferase (adenine-specific)
MTVQVLQGDCRETLRTLPDNLIDSCVTDPPYHLVSIVKRFGGEKSAALNNNDSKTGRNGPYTRSSVGFMGKQWDGGDIAFTVEFWFEVFRVLKPGAYLAAFGATRGYHRMACAIEDAGFEIRDSLCWLYGTGFPKSHDVSKGVDRAVGAEREKVAPRSVIGHQRDSGNMRPYMLDPNHVTDSDIPATPAAQEWQGWGTALKPAVEPIVLARKPLSESTVAANVLRWRTGAINIDACRVGIDPTADASQLRTMSRGQRTDDTSGQTWGLSKNGSDVPQVVRPDGRWPANVVHDGSDEVIAAFPESKSTPYIENDPAGDAMYRGGIKHRSAGGFSDSGSTARFFYSAKASKADRNGSKHPTVKPIALMQWLARLITPPGGLVLDPFAGSGTTGAACELESFNCILIEREAEYVADIQRRFTPAFPWALAKIPFPWNTP